MNAEKKPRAPRVTKSAADLKADLAKARAALAALEQRAYAGELEEAVNSAGIPDLFAKVKKQVNGASDIAILAAIGKAAGIARLEITQKPSVPRKQKS